MERIKEYDETLLISSGDKDGIRDLAEHLKSGEVVAFPTETVYGLGANAYDSEAVEKIFRAKGRPGDNPLICHIADKSQIEDIVSEVTPLAGKLIDAFMPGPITIIMRKSDKIPANVTAGLDTVGVRMPSDPTANAFLKACGVPVAAPSANLSGSPSPTDAQSVMEDMDGYIYAVLDGGDSVFGLESTVVDATGETPVILRPGAVTEAAIEMAASSAPAEAGSLEAGATPKAPGMKYRHYAPVAKVEIMQMPDAAVIVNDDYDGDITSKPEEITEEIDFKQMDDDAKQALVDIAAPFIFGVQELIKDNPFARAGLYCGAEVRQLFAKLGDEMLLKHVNFYVYGRSTDVRAASHHLFGGLRHLDMQEVDVIFCQGFGGTGLSKAYMNRLSKAAGGTGELAPGMPGPARPARRQLPLDHFKDTYTASVLFVCDDNRCMSPACEALMRAMLEEQAPYMVEGRKDIGCEIYCESAGLFATPGQSSDTKMADRIKTLCGRTMSSYKAVRTEPSVYDSNDLILTVRDEQAFEIVSAFPEIKDKVYSLSTFAAANGLVFKSDDGKVISFSIPDPAGENDATYDHTAKALQAYLRLLFPYILKWLGIERC